MARPRSPGGAQARRRIDFRAAQVRNRRRVRLLLAVFLGLVGLSGWWLGAGFMHMRSPAFGEEEAYGLPPTPVHRDYRYLLAGTALLLGFVGVRRIRRTGDRVLLGLVDAKPLSEERFENVAAEMALSAGLRRPRLYVVEDPAPNAFACGWDDRNAAITVTRGLLDLLDRDELQGVVAHEMAHIQGGHTRLMTLVLGMRRAVRVLVPFALGPLGALWLAPGQDGADARAGPPEAASTPAWLDSPSPAQVLLLVVATPIVALAFLAVAVLVSLTLTAIFFAVLLAVPFAALGWALWELWQDVRTAGAPPAPGDPTGEPARPGAWMLLLLVPCGLVVGPAILLVGLVAPVSILLVRLAISRSQELEADAGAVELTRRPGALASALRKLRDASPAALPASLAPLCIAPLHRSEGDGLSWRVLLSTHPSLDERIRRLEAMG